MVLISYCDGTLKTENGQKEEHYYLTILCEPDNTLAAYSFFIFLEILLDTMVTGAHVTDLVGEILTMAGKRVG